MYTRQADPLFFSSSHPPLAETDRGAIYSSLHLSTYDSSASSEVSGEIFQAADDAQ